MHFATYALGVVLLAVSLGVIGVATVAVTRRALPGWRGAAARVAEAVAGLAMLLVALELAGLTGLLTRAGVPVACAIVSAVAWGLVSRLVPTPQAASAAAADPSPEVGAADTSRWEVVLAALGIAAVGAAWATRVIASYRSGMEAVDTLWYHMPLAARFAERGSILGLHYVDGDAIIVWYAANAELVHAFGLVLFRSDLLSPLVNLGWAALALTAGWAIGRPTGRAPHCLLAVALVLGIPALVDFQPGQAYNDVVCLALILSAAALLVNGGLRRGPVAFAAMAAGIALGTKFTMIAPVVALAAGAVLLAKGDRWRQLVLWVGGLVLLGGYWYVRNIWAVGNPLPNLAHVGAISLPSPDVRTLLFTVASSITDGHVVRAYYLPGLQHSLGPAAWALLLLAALGALLALLSRQAVAGLLAAVAVVSGVAFLFTPQPLGLPGAPFYFQYNVGRFGAVPLALGLVLLPMQLRGRRVRAAFLAVAAVVLVVTQLAPSIWPSGLPLARLSAPVGGGPAVAGAIAAVLCLAAFALGRWWISHPRPRVASPNGRPALAAVTAAAAVLVVGGWIVARSYAARRYTATGPLPAIFDEARSLHHVRIGFTGLLLQYPLYGIDGSNYVQFVGARRPHGGFGAITNCPEWRRAVNRGRYRFLLLAPRDFPLNPRVRIAPEVAWTAASPSAHLVRREVGPIDTAALYRLDGRLDPASCPPPRVRRRRR